MWDSLLREQNSVKTYIEDLKNQDNEKEQESIDSIGDEEVIIHGNISKSSIIKNDLLPFAFTNSIYPKDVNPICVDALCFQCPIVGIPNLPYPLIGRCGCLNRTSTKFVGPSFESIFGSEGIVEIVANCNVKQY
ncbi:MAG: hypothetical protein EZS28_007031 [Streblomastix strix]|uniref:Uncharacterized protein n=1 Tax=Streblomastix strix TaxID=222440 RepID=A0A5J4WRA0_9EUKA|nr:MAG: hypothetical protein EZS28_007031 [Streblomastix strix]